MITSRRPGVIGSALVAVLVAVAFLAPPVPASAEIAAAKKVKGPKVVLNDACTLLWSKRIDKALGGPVVVMPGTTFAGPTGCVAAIGDDPAAAPGGTIQAYQEYPTLLSGLENARAALEDRRAGDSLSNDTVNDVDGVGIAAYFNDTKRAITVLATKKYTFTMQWERSGDVAIRASDRKALIALAKDAVARFTR